MPKEGSSIRACSVTERRAMAMLLRWDRRVGGDSRREKSTEWPCGRLLHTGWDLPTSAPRAMAPSPCGSCIHVTRRFRETVRCGPMPRPPAPCHGRDSAQGLPCQGGSCQFCAQQPSWRRRPGGGVGLVGCYREKATCTESATMLVLRRFQMRVQAVTAHHAHLGVGPSRTGAKAAAASHPARDPPMCASTADGTWRSLCDRMARRQDQGPVQVCSLLPHDLCDSWEKREM
jgi:hypothetical protein